MATQPSQSNYGDARGAGRPQAPASWPKAAPSRGHRNSEQLRRRDSAMPRRLGWLSLGLGLGGLLAPRALASTTGLAGKESLVRLIGARELVAAAGLLTLQNPTPWLWARVVGDLMDLAVLASSAMRAGAASERRRSLVTLGVIGAVTATDVAASVRYTRGSAGLSGSRLDRGRASDAALAESMVVNKSPEECYRFWRDLEQLPRFMSSVESVTALDDKRSRWVVSAPGGLRVQWDAEITQDEPGKRLAWHSLPNSQVAHAGVVRFDVAPGSRGTVVHVVAHYQLLPGAVGGAGLTRLLEGAPNARLREELRKFKQLIEAGEVATTEGQAHGPRSVFGKVMQRWSLT